MKKLIIIALMLPLGACATVIRGTKETAKFESVPSGATVIAESISDDKLGPFKCVTPCKLKLKRKRKWDIAFEMDGYKHANGVLRKKVTAGGVTSGAGNVLLGGLIGIGVDAGTGANLDLRPNPMIAVLAPLDGDELSMIEPDPEAEELEAEEGEDTPQTEERAETAVDAEVTE